MKPCHHASLPTTRLSWDGASGQSGSTPPEISFFPSCIQTVNKHSPHTCPPNNQSHCLTNPHNSGRSHMDSMFSPLSYFQTLCNCPVTWSCPLLCAFFLFCIYSSCLLLILAVLLLIFLYHVQLVWSPPNSYDKENFVAVPRRR